MQLFSPGLLVSVACNQSFSDRFKKYTNIDDVLAQKNGWEQTLNSQFGNRNANELPPQWNFYLTTDKAGGKCYHRFCGTDQKTFIWTKDSIDNSQPNYLQINFQQGQEYTDPNDASFKTKNFSGSVSTEKYFKQAFGYWEVNAKFLDKHYGWSAFWLQTYAQSQIGNGGKDGSEIDIFESFNWDNFQNEVCLHIFADGYGERSKQYDESIYYVNNKHAPINIYNDFHKFGLLWTPDAYYMFVDHNLVFKTNASYATDCPSKDDKLMGVCQTPLFAVLSGHLGPNEPGETTNKTPSWLTMDEYNGPGKFLIKNFVCYQNRNFIPYIKSPSDFK